MKLCYGNHGFFSSCLTFAEPQVVHFAANPAVTAYEELFRMKTIPVFVSLQTVIVFDWWCRQHRGGSRE